MTVLNLGPPWTVQDGFAMAHGGDHLARLVLEVRPPFTVGVFGKWGAGKTSLMRRAFACLGGVPIVQELKFEKEAGLEAGPGEAGWKNALFSATNRDYPLDWEAELQNNAWDSFYVWYSPWQQQSHDRPLYGLLRELYRQFESWQQKAKKAERFGALAVGKALSDLLDSAASIDLGILTTPFKILKAGKSAIKAGHEEYQRQTGQDLLQHSDGQRFHILFQDVVNLLLQYKEATQEQMREYFEPADGPALKPRLVFFIDDLDRCEESIVVQLLESIKLFLHCENCVFVLGVDDSAILKALGRHWQGRSEEDNREYLEKLFQAYFPVPMPNSNNMTQYIERQLKAHDFPDAETLAKKIVELLEPNPRKLKNFLNSLCATWRMVSCARPSIKSMTKGENMGKKLAPQAAPEGKIPEVLSQMEQASSPIEPATQENPDIVFANRFVLMHYLRLCHRPVWRFLERQPKLLTVLTRVLKKDSEAFASSDATDESLVDQEEQIPQRFFKRAFAHVLRDQTFTGDAKADEEAPLHISLEQASELLNERLDRRRSDHTFIRWYAKYFDKQDPLPAEFLHLC